MTDRTIIIMANEVSTLMKSGFDYKSATRQILRLHQIANDWSVYFSKIGEELGRRKPKKVNKIISKKEKHVVKRPPVQILFPFSP